MPFMITTAARLSSLVPENFEVPLDFHSGCIVKGVLKLYIARNISQKRSCLLDTEVSPYSCGSTVMDVVSKRDTVNK